MIQICRTSAIVLLAALLVLPGTLFADPLTYQGQPLASIARVDVTAIAPTPPVSGAAAFTAGQYGYGGHHRHNDAAMAAILIGAAAAIAGTAILVYANRPECGVSDAYSGCGYGSKVVGGSLLAGGMVGVIVGAATWR